MGGSGVGRGRIVGWWVGRENGSGLKCFLAGVAAGSLGFRNPNASLSADLENERMKMKEKD